VSEFNVGEAVVCVDASDIPTPPWAPLVAGKEYIIRSIELADVPDAHYDKNIHKKSRYVVRLEGIYNMSNIDAAKYMGLNGTSSKELGYADSRFEKIEEEEESEEVYEEEEIAA